jgi:RNA-directed DNA polymerase
LTLIEELRNVSNWQADAIRRTYIEKRGTTEKRGLGIPTMRDRAMQKLVALALEPEWEAKFEPNSYGFRPGRSTHDAIEAIFNHIRLKPKYVLDADIEKCFDRIDRSALAGSGYPGRGQGLVPGSRRTARRGGFTVVVQCGPARL